MPDFMQVFDGGQPVLSEAEQLTAGHSFESLVDTLMFTHIANVADARASRTKWPRDELLLGKPAPAGAWDIHVTSSKMPENEDDLPLRVLPGKMLSLVFFDQEDREREEFLYSLGTDGVVRREDAGDRWEAEQAEDSLRGEGLLPQESGQMLPANATDEERKAFFDRLFSEADALNGAENAAMEVDMGLNNQPVGVQEIEGLAAMLQAPDVHPRKPRGWRL